jgi:phosphoglycerate dehydrogenase-like enzyme
MYKIACFDQHEPEVKQILFSILPRGFSMEIASENTVEERIRIAKDADFILTGWTAVEKEVLENGKKLKLVQKMGIGYDKIDISEAKKLGITVAITAGANATPVAEFALMLMLAVYRKLSYVDKSLRQGLWLKNRMRAETKLLFGKTVGLLGFGNIGRMICRLLRPFSTKILYYDILRPSREEEEALGVEYCQNLEKLLSSSDVVSVHLPLTNGTRNIINESNISSFKKGAILINTSRGGVVSEAALHKALANGTLAGAGIDVFENEPPSVKNPLFALDNVVVTPHMAGAVLDNVINVGKHSFENMVKVLNGEPLRASDVIVAGKAFVE